VLLSASVCASSSPLQTTVGPPIPRRLVIGVDGGTESIRACLFDAIDGSVVGKSCAVP